MNFDETFKENIRHFFNIESEMKELADKIKDLRESRAHYEEKIIEKMKQSGITELNIPGVARICLGTAKQTKPINKKDIQSVLAKDVGAERADKLIEDLWNSREVQEVDKIRTRKAFD
jgi:glutamyl-tRNA reductase